MTTITAQHTDTLLDALRRNLDVLGELAMRHQVELLPERPDDVPSVSCAEDVQRLVGREMSQLAQEQVRVLLLDRKNKVVGQRTIYQGNAYSAIVRAASAPPLSPAAGTDLNGDRLTFDRALEAPGRFFGRNVFRNRAMRNLDMRLLRRFATSDTSYLELSLEVFNALNLENVEYGRFNQIYGPGLDLATGTPVAAQDSFLRLRADDGSYDRNNSQVPGTGPLQMQIGLRFIF